MKSVFFIILASILSSCAHALSQEEIFARAIQNRSTAPNFVVLNICDANGSCEERCVEAPLLLGALQKENGIPFTEEGSKKALQLALAQTSSRSFTFLKKEAQDNLSIRYSKEDLKEAEALISPMSDKEIKSGFKDGSLLKKVNHDHFWNMMPALAYVLIKRGFEVGLGDVPPVLYLGNAGFQK